MVDEAAAAKTTTAAATEQQITMDEVEEDAAAAGSVVEARAAADLVSKKEMNNKEGGDEEKRKEEEEVSADAIGGGGGAAAAGNNNEVPHTVDTTDNDDGVIEDDTVPKTALLELEAVRPLVRPGAVAVPSHNGEPNSLQDHHGTNNEQGEESALSPTTGTSELVSANRVSDVEMVYVAENVKNSKTPLGLVLFLFGVIALATAIGVILGTSSNDDANNNNSSSSTSNSNSNNNGDGPLQLPPTMAPISTQCFFCYGSDMETMNTLLENINLEGIIVSQDDEDGRGRRTCQDIYDETLTMTIQDDTCRINQAEAGWKCGCDTFPPIPETSNCTICQEVGQTPVPTTVLGSLSVCAAASKWLPIVGNGLPTEECDELRRQIDTCICASDNNSNNNSEPICIDDLTSITLSEAQVEDSSIERTYVLCPNTVFVTGQTDLETFDESSTVVNGQLPITGRSNLRIICGDNGSLSNNCTIRDGSHGAHFMNGWVYPGETTRDNIHFQGIRWVNMTHPIAAYTVTNMTIVNCIFEENFGVPIASMPWILGRPPVKRHLLSNQEDMIRPPHTNMRSRSVQTVPVEGDEDEVVAAHIGKITVIDCIFRNNVRRRNVVSAVIQMRRATPEYTPIPGTPTVMALHIENCRFENNFGYTKFVNSIGYGALTMVNNCFVGSEYVDAPVVVERTGGRGIGPLPPIIQEKNFFRHIPSNESSALQEVCMIRERNLTCVSYFDGTLEEEVCSS